MNYVMTIWIYMGHVMCKFTTKKTKDSVHKNVDALSPRTISPMSDTMPVGIICETSSSGALGFFTWRSSGRYDWRDMTGYTIQPIKNTLWVVDIGGCV